MAIRPFLAMTAAEMRNAASFPEKTAWMACHFSPYGTGLSGLPASLPPDCLLILNDRTPINGHDPQRIVKQLTECIERLGCTGLLLDFQRPGYDETHKLIHAITSALHCPVGVSEPYAQDVDCSVFLSPVPPSTPPRESLAPWQGRDIWLELALDGEIITLTEQGADVTSLPFPDTDAQGFQEDALHCHYKIELEEKAARFTLWRTWDDLQNLMAETEELGVTNCIGLYQELHSVIE